MPYTVFSATAKCWLSRPVEKDKKDIGEGTVSVLLYQHRSLESLVVSKCHVCHQPGGAGKD